MDRHTVPPGLARALRRAGLQLGGPLGSGGAGPRWSATAPDGSRWAVTLVAPSRADLARRRAAALAELDSPHLAKVHRAEVLPDGGVVVRQAAVDGTDLTVLAAARGGLTPGEVVGVVADLASGLALLHRAGLAHGDVSPANVVVGRHGAVLVDLVSGADPREQGTDGFAAPERRVGADPAGDVHALARTGLWLLRGATDEAIRTRLVRSADPDPARRGSAADLARDLSAAGTRQSVTLPDPAVLARLSLHRMVGRAAAGRDAAGRDAAGLTTRRRGAGRHARRRRIVPPRARRAAAALVVAAAGLLVVSGPGTPDDAGGARRPLVPPSVGASWATVVRTQALVRGQGDLLASVTLPGSPAATADVALRGVLARSGTAPEVAVLGAVAGPALPTCCTGRGRSTQVATTVWTLLPDGARSAEVTLLLHPVSAGWRVAAVRPGGR